MYILIHRHIFLNDEPSFCIGLWWWYIHKYSNMQYLSGLASPVICTGGSRKSEESATKQGNAPHKRESGDHFNFVAGISPCGKGQMNCQDITHTSGTQTIVTIVAFDTTPEVCRDLYKVAKFRGQVVLAVACTMCWLLVAVVLCQQDKHGKRKTTEKANVWILWILQLQVLLSSFFCAVEKAAVQWDAYSYLLVTDIPPWWFWLQPLCLASPQPWGASGQGLVDLMVFRRCPVNRHWKECGKFALQIWSESVPWCHSARLIHEWTMNLIVIVYW